METVSDRIRALRKHLSVNQVQLARLAGVSKQAVWKWEQGLSVPERDALLKLQLKKQVNPRWVTEGQLPMLFAGVADGSPGYLESPDLLHGLTRTQRAEVLQTINDLRRLNQEVIDEIKKEDSGAGMDPANPGRAAEIHRKPN